MLILSSFINVFLSPVIVSITKTRAQASGMKQFTFNGIEIYCPADKEQLILDAIEIISEFYEDKWGICKNLKRIIIDTELRTVTWISQGTVVIQISDASRMSSATHLAGWLIAHYEKIRTLKEKHSTAIIWSRKIMAQANEKSLVMRKKYLSQR